MKKYLGTILLTLLGIPAIAGATLYEYYTEQGLNLPSVEERSIEAQKYGIEPYSGTEDQNNVLEGLLRGESVLGAVLPIAGSTYNLSGSGISSSATSITLQSFTLPQNGYYIQDSDLSTTFYLTLEPGNRSRQEIVSCTTVTQNGAGTATLSSCTRGLSPVTPFTASSTLQFSHSGGSQVILSDPPQLFNQFVDKDNESVVRGSFRLATTTESNTRLIFGDNSGAYIWYNSTTDAFGFATSSASERSFSENGQSFAFVTPLSSASGEVKLATSTYAFVLRDSALAIATSTISSGTASGVALDDHWNDRFIATTTKETFTVRGNFQAPSSTITTLLNTVATTTQTFNVGDKICAGTANCINSFDMEVASSTAAALSITGSGTLTSFATTTIPGNVLGPNGFIVLRFWFNSEDTGGTPDTLTVQFGSTTVCVGAVGIVDANGRFECEIKNNNSVSAQKSYEKIEVDGALTVLTGALTSTSINTAVSQDLTVHFTSDNAADNMIIDLYTVEQYYRP